MWQQRTSGLDEPRLWLSPAPEMRERERERERERSEHNVSLCSGIHEHVFVQSVQKYATRCQYTFQSHLAAGLLSMATEGQDTQT